MESIKKTTDASNKTLLLFCLEQAQRLLVRLETTNVESNAYNFLLDAIKLTKHFSGRRGEDKKGVLTTIESLEKHLATIKKEVSKLHIAH